MNKEIYTIIKTSLLAMLMLFMLSACSVIEPFLPEKEVPVAIIVNTAIIELKSTDTINPDLVGEASPLIVRVYELKTDSQFTQTDFFDIYDSEQEALSGELISRQEHTVIPGKVLRKTVVLSPDTTFIGVVAAFRDIDQAQWRAISPILPGEVLYNVKLDDRTVEFQ